MFHPFIHISLSSGFYALTQALDDSSTWSPYESERFLIALQQMFAISADKKEDDLKSFKESYLRYKRKYVKHIGFNPDNDNLSNLTFHYMKLSKLIMFLSTYIQFLCWSMHRLNRYTSTLTRQPTMRLRGMRR